MFSQRWLWEVSFPEIRRRVVRRFVTRRFGGTYRLHIQGRRIVQRASEGGGGKFVAFCLPAGVHGKGGNTGKDDYFTFGQDEQDIITWFRGFRVSPAVNYGIQPNWQNLAEKILNMTESTKARFLNIAYHASQSTVRSNQTSLRSSYSHFLHHHQTNSAVYSVNARNKHFLHRPVANLACFQKSTYYSGINIFNNLSSSLKSLINEKAKFKSSAETILKYILILLCWWISIV
jgi:IS1 family transposase